MNNYATNRVFVRDSNNKDLMPCLPVRAQELLDKNRAIVYKLMPFTIKMKDRFKIGGCHSNICQRTKTFTFN